MNQRTSATFRVDFDRVSDNGDPLAERKAWLSLGQAATAIGVHPITLRRWAETGQVPSSRTVGGHRRFLRTDVEACVRGRRRLRRLGGLEGKWAAHAQSAMRREGPFDPGKGIPLDPRDRRRFRRSGRRLMGLMTGVYAGAIDAEGAERRARRLGRAYASWASDRGVATSDMVHAFGFVRQTLIGAAIDLAQSENLEPNAVRGLVAVLEELTRAVELGLLEAALPSGTPPGKAG